MNLSKIIIESLDKRLPDAPRAYVGASSIGHECSRMIWYSLHNAQSEGIPPRLRVTFDIGNKLEAMLLDYLERAGVRIVRPALCNDELLFSEKNLPVFKGHADALLVKEDGSRSVVEIKTAKSSSFQAFKTKGLKSWSAVYYAQIQAYLGMGSMQAGVLLAINKDSSEMHHEWVQYDDIFYHELLSKAQRIADAEEPPDRIGGPFYFVCKMCRFRKICHDEGA